jgi:hypothetical protein
MGKDRSPQAQPPKSMILCLDATKIRQGVQRIFEWKNWQVSQPLITIPPANTDSDEEAAVGRDMASAMGSDQDSHGLRQPKSLTQTLLLIGARKYI